MIPQHRLQLLLHRKDAREAAAECSAWGYTEGWAICDGALVIYNVDNPPEWFKFRRDENGNSLGHPNCGCMADSMCTGRPGCVKAVPEDEPTLSRAEQTERLLENQRQWTGEYKEALKIEQAKKDERVPEYDRSEKKSAGSINIDLTINGKKPDEYIKGLDSALSLLGRFAKR